MPMCQTLGIPARDCSIWPWKPSGQGQRLAPICKVYGLNCHSFGPFTMAILSWRVLKEGVRDGANASLQCLQLVLLSMVVLCGACVLLPLSQQHIDDRYEMTNECANGQGFHFSCFILGITSQFVSGESYVTHLYTHMYTNIQIGIYICIYIYMYRYMYVHTA